MNTVEKFFIDKLKETMEFLVINDPNLLKNFQESKKLDCK